MNRLGTDGKKSGKLSSFFRSSLIISSIDKFTSYIYSLFGSGLFGKIFTGYRHETKTVLSENKKESRGRLSEIRRSICRFIESSFFVNLVKNIADFFLECKMKVYGAFLVSFAVYNIIVTSFTALVKNDVSVITGNTGVAVALVIGLASIPLIFSKKNLAEALTSSFIGKAVLRYTGYTSLEHSGKDAHRGNASIGFILGVIVAVVTHTFNPLLVLGGILAVVWAYLVLIRPEIGVLTMFFAMPFLPTMVLAAIVIYTFLCFCIKLLRGKRVLRFEPIDIVVIAFTAILFSGGIITLSPDSLKPALLMVCLIMGYFLTVELIESREWLVRCSVTAVVSASLVSLYGIITYYTGSGYYSKAWLDSDMFNGISNRAVSTLENPNMLGEYLILLLPIALVMLIGKGEGLRKLPALFCIALMGACLLLTWSRGAWLALIVALVCFLFMWHYRSIWLVLLGVASIPILPSILPQSIINRFASIGNMSDSSTSYRVYIWRAAVNMLKDNAVAGIGIGESAWRRLYPLYAYMGIEVAPHSHNLFIQTWLELGVFGFAALVVFIFLLLKSAFSLFSDIKSCSLKTAELSERMLLDNTLFPNSKVESRSASRRQIRLSVIGPLTGIIAVLVQGMTDYSWYNYRLYLMFWLVAGLTVAYIRNGNSYIEHTPSVVTEIKHKKKKREES